MYTGIKTWIEMHLASSKYVFTLCKLRSIYLCFVNQTVEGSILSINMMCSCHCGLSNNKIQVYLYDLYHHVLWGDIDVSRSMIQLCELNTLFQGVLKKCSR